MKLKTLHIKNPSKELLLFLRNLRDNKRRNNESTFTIRIERNGCKKYSFVLIKDNDTANGKQITLSDKQRIDIEKLLNPGK